MKLFALLIFFTQLLKAQSWLQLNDFPAAERDDGVAVTVGNTAYFGTGNMATGGISIDFYALNAANSWTPIASMPQYTQRQYACAFAGPNSFFIFSGDGFSGPLNDLYKYDIASNSWSAKTSRPGAGVYGAACLEFGNKIVVAGGKSAAGSGQQVSDLVWEYTISSDSWQQKANFPGGGRFRASAAVINGNGYLMFGIDENGRMCKDMYRYDQGSDTWTKVLDFPQGMGRSYAAMRQVNNKLVLFGGYDSLNVYHKDVWFFDPASEQWMQQNDLPSFGRKGGMSTVLGNNFYYSCGIDANNTRLKETWVLDVPVGIRENEWQSRFAVHPNPGKELIYVEGNEHNRIAQLLLTDVCGKEIKQSTVASAQSASLLLDDITAGIYLLKIVTNEAVVVSKKIVVE